MSFLSIARSTTALSKLVKLQSGGRSKTGIEVGREVGHQDWGSLLSNLEFDLRCGRGEAYDPIPARGCYINTSKTSHARCQIA
jgi:hypothetical protein